jgi:hypothetical protein
MIRAESACTSEHGKNCVDSWLVSDMAIFRQSTAFIDQIPNRLNPRSIQEGTVHARAVL